MTCKKILFINPAFGSGYTPRYGLAMLSAVLRARGHIVKIADYAFSGAIPDALSIFSEFQPNVVCFSIFSSGKEVVEQLINRIRVVDNVVPIVCGGPHATCAPEELLGNMSVDYIVKGEAEDIVCEVIENAERQKKPIIISSPGLPDVNSLPFPDFSAFIDYERMQEYPLCTSRGCPYSCSYCVAGLVCSKKYRPRSIDSVIDEIETATAKYPSIRYIGICDDSFNTHRQRGIELLKRIADLKRSKLSKCVVSVGNFRADRVDDELLRLFKDFGYDIGWIGVESANEQVFNLIRKGETLEHIHKACSLIVRNKMKLYLNFIIGLPGDCFENIYESIRFAKKYGAFKMYWNLLVVYRGTAAYEWFRNNGTVVEGHYPPAYVDEVTGPSLNCYTSTFPAADRLNAWRLARIVTGEAPLLPNIKLLCGIWKKYHIPFDIIASSFMFRLIRFRVRWLSWYYLLLQSPRNFLARFRSAVSTHFRISLGFIK